MRFSWWPDLMISWISSMKRPTRGWPHLEKSPKIRTLRTSSVFDPELKIVAFEIKGLLEYMEQVLNDLVVVQHR